MTTFETTISAPLTLWDDDSIRVVGSRIPLDTIVYQFKIGSTAEQIQDGFPSLTLRQIYGAIFYYLEHTETVEEYLRQRDERAEEIRRMIESQPENIALREKLRARRHQMLVKA